MYRRNIEWMVRAALADTPVVLLRGARQVGKTTLARSLTDDTRAFLTFDDLGTRSAAQRDPMGFVAGLRGPVILDEIQRVPELLFPIKQAVDRHRVPGNFLLTGSSDVLASRETAGLLAGRVEALTLWPLSQGEIRGRRESFIDRAFEEASPPAGEWPGGGVDVLSAALAGGYPETLTRQTPRRREAWFKSYVAMVIEREIRELAAIENLMVLPDVLKALGSRAAGLLNIADAARTCGLPHWTFTRYLALLEAAYLVWRLPAWSRGLAGRIAKAPKVMFGDTGLLAHLTGINTREAAIDRQLAGALIENLVAVELLKQSGWAERQVSLLHFRTHQGREVDLVLEDRAGRIVGIEVKSRSTARPEDFAGLRHLENVAGGRFERGILLYGGVAAIPFGSRLHALPFNALWEPW